MERAVTDVVNRVRRRVRDATDVDAIAAIAREEAARRAEDGRQGVAEPSADEIVLERQALAELRGLGALQPLYDDPRIEEIWVNAPDRVFVSTGGATRRVDLDLTHDAVREITERILAPTTRRLDLSCPFVDASLPDGSRFHAVIPDITASSWSINIRKFVSGTHDIDDLRKRGMISEPAWAYLAERLAAGESVIVSGATHSGKTTLLAAMLNAGCVDERVISVEETFELALTMDDHVALQCRPANLEGVGAVGLRQLVRESLRMRPSRIIVGEVRGAEALELLIAANTGVPTGCTVHANSALDACRKLTLLPLLAGSNIDRSFVAECIASGIGTIVHVEQGADGVRRVAEIAHPQLEQGVLSVRHARWQGHDGAIPVAEVADGSGVAWRAAGTHETLADTGVARDKLRPGSWSDEAFRDEAVP